MRKQACQHSSSSARWSLGEEWKVCDVWFKERRDIPDELHVRVAHKRSRL
jgi:hypothetical protein